MKDQHNDDKFKESRSYRPDKKVTRKYTIITITITTLIIGVIGFVYGGYRYIKYRKEVAVMELRNRYQQAAKEFLEDKYGEEFYVWDEFFDPREPWPGNEFSTPFGFDTFAYPVSNKDAIFKVQIIREEDSNEIESINDDYFWKFLKPQLQDYTLEKLGDTFGEMKVVAEYRLRTSLPDQLNNNSTLEDFLRIFRERDSHPIVIYLDLFINPNSKVYTKNEIEQIVTKFLLEVKQNMTVYKSLYFSVYQVPDQFLYEGIDPDHMVQSNFQYVDYVQYYFNYVKRQLNIDDVVDFRKECERIICIEFGDIV